MNKVLNISLWAFLALVFLVLWGFTASEHNGKICQRLEIFIDEMDGNFFINEKDIEVSLSSENLHPVGRRLGDVDLLELENKIEQIAEVKVAKVYKNLNGVITVGIKQRKPIVRIINANGNQFYLDDEGYQMPLSENYTPRVPVVTGYINEPFSEYSATEIAKNEMLSKTVKSDEVFTLVNYLRSNKFWNAQVQQINFNRHGEIELIPTLGEHLIVLGDLDNYEGKLNKLKIFYSEGLNHMDWNMYDTINIKYKNQIICTKK